MKQIITLVSLFTFGVLTTNASGGDPVSNVLQASIQRTFSGAKLLKWNELPSSELLYASILYNNERLNAYFDPEGNLIATGRFIKAEALPLIVSKSMKDKYPTATITDVVEYMEKSGTSYLITMEQDSREMIIRAFNDGSSFVFKKSKKNFKTL